MRFWQVVLQHLLRKKNSARLTMTPITAYRKRCSEIQRRFSISSLCINAVCPAGPPKLMKPSSANIRMFLLARFYMLVGGGLCLAWLCLLACVLYGSAKKREHRAPLFHANPLSGSGWEICFINVFQPARAVQSIVVVTVCVRVVPGLE